jgi:rhodanese-related sulfurtransferase
MAKTIAKKKQIKQEEEKKEIFYVGVRDPTEVRRNILEASKDIVVFLKTYENFKRVRIEKVQEVNNLKLLIDQITRIMNKLRRELPKTRIREKSEETIQKTGGRRVVRIPPKKASGASSELDRLEAELNEIDQKLRML